MSEGRRADLLIVIVSWNTAGLLERCLKSFLGVPPAAGTEVVVVDNASSDGTVEMLRAVFPGVQLLQNDCNEGFAGAANRGIAATDSRFVLLLNSDTEVPAGVLDSLVEFMDDSPDAGAVGPRLLQPDGEAQPYSYGGDPRPAYLLGRALLRLTFRRYLHDWSASEVKRVDWVSGACMMIRREALGQVGMLDDNMFMYFEDNDLCLRLRKRGWRVYFNPKLVVTHIGGRSLAKNPAARREYYRSLNYFYAKHYGRPARLALRLGVGLAHIRRWPAP